MNWLGSPIATSSAPAGDSQPGAAALEIDNVSVAYEHRLVLRGVRFTCPAGSLVGIVGPNGAGKSTLLKAVLGLVPLAAGSVRIFGQPAPLQRHRVAYVPQRELVDWDFPVTVGEVVMMGRVTRMGWLRRASPRDRDRVSQALEAVGMQELRHRPIGRLSGGQQQRTFLARALAQEADLLLLDEPFVGVDAATHALIEQTIGRLRNEGKTILLINHDLGAARRCDLVALINGRLVAFGPPAEVLMPDKLQATYGGTLAFLDQVERGQVAPR